MILPYTILAFNALFDLPPKISPLSKLALEPSGEIVNSLISLSSYRSSRAKNVHTNFLTVLRLVLSELPG